MIKINDTNIVNKYIMKYKIKELFSEDISHLMELILFKKGEYICRENEAINYIFFFIEGKAKVYITLSNGKSLLLYFYQDFKVLGDLEFINYKAATSNVQVIEDTYCIGINLEKARENLLNDSKFLRYICSSLGEKLSRCSKNSSINLLFPLENRLASYILAAGEKTEDNGITIKLNENLTEISELLGTSYRHLLRTLNNLQTKKLIIKKDGYFEVINDKVLRDLAADLYK